MTKKITWLHLSDLHIGQSGQWLWPNFKSIFMTDMLRLAKEDGPIDLVIFSGDLTQKGETSEFDNLTAELKFVWEKLKSIDQNPYLFIVPGNHDLQRPVASDARVKLIKQWGADPDIQKEFWGDASNQYLDVVNSAFKNYSSWVETLKKSEIRLAANNFGIIPGDGAGCIEINGIKVGLIGLNSSFLQLGNENYEGKLSLDVRQINAITGNDPSGWCQQNDINFLVTHHPTSWLSVDSLQHYKAEIYPSGRFTAHLCGHMHNAEMYTTSKGGDGGRKHYQSTSLFGMEFLGDGSTTRVHGYSIGSIFLDENGIGSWKLWPRKALLNKSSGDRRIVPDHENFHIVPGKEYIEEQLHRANALSSQIVVAAQKIDLAAKVEETNQNWNNALDGTKFLLHSQSHHSDVRLLQQQSFLEGIRKNKMIWVCSDWSLGRDGFIWSSLFRNGIGEHPVYRINLGNYTLRDEFISGFSSEVGCSFPEYCKALTNIGPAILIFEESPVTTGEEKTEYIEQDVENLASMVMDFCPETIVVMLARTTPKKHKAAIVRLEPLDEVDTKTYLSKHPNATQDLLSAKAVSEIFRFTDGFPGKIDRALKKLRVVGLDELGPQSTSEIVSIENSSEDVPMSLVLAVKELAESTDLNMKRSYLLLTVLAILPNGETLQRLKRIKPDAPIYPLHAEELLERDLIRANASASLIGSQSGGGSSIKLLVAPTPVRDYILKKMSTTEIENIVGKALSLYFGDDWETGSPSLKKINGNSFSDDANLLHNPHFLITQLLCSSTTWSNPRFASIAIQLCKTYCAIIGSKNYRLTVTACRDFIRMIPESGFEADVDTINLILAGCLRMMGQHDEAKELIIRLIDIPRSNSARASLLLDYALCLQSLGDVKASEVASEIIKIFPGTATAAHAQAIILEMQIGVDNSRKLIKLESETRKKNYVTVANNLTLSRVAKSNDADESLAALKQVYSTAIANTDRYTAARATVKMAELYIRSGNEIIGEDLNRLIDAYQYFYGERFKSLFTSAHKSLWTIFQQRDEPRNLLSLFRHSSFIWRLQGDEFNEKKYVDILMGASRHLLNTDIRTADQNTGYFLLRATSLIVK
ncbi:metallophosphoesterase [Cellvibrio mixtus]|nr:metallophosphoesterase [Cellvibrio mixtus]